MPPFPLEQPPMSGPPNGPMSMLPMPDMGALFGGIASLAQRMPVESVTDKMKKVMDLLDEVRSKDSKQAPNIGMALHILKNGTADLERFDFGTPKKEGTTRNY